MSEAVKRAQPAFALTATTRRAFFLGTSCLLVCILPAIFVRHLLKDLLALVWDDDAYSHIPFVLAVSAFFLVTDRKRIFATPAGPRGMPAAIAIAGAAGMALASTNPRHWSESDQISLLVLGFVLLWTGAFGIFFGEDAMRVARFPLLFLWFAIPMPKAVLSEVIALLQRASADTVEVVFRLFHTPAARHGFEFALPGVTIRVAEECSGIRSTLALVMTAALAAHLWLRSFGRSLLLCLAIIPIAILKNALRIAVLSWLAVYVDMRFLTGSIHHQYGGMIFFVVGLLMMWAVLAVLQRRFPFGVHATSAPDERERAS
jgi:exosortase